MGSAALVGCIRRNMRIDTSSRQSDLIGPVDGVQTSSWRCWCRRSCTPCPKSNETVVGRRDACGMQVSGLLCSLFHQPSKVDDSKACIVCSRGSTCSQLCIELIASSVRWGLIEEREREVPANRVNSFLLSKPTALSPRCEVPQARQA